MDDDTAPCAKSSKYGRGQGEQFATCKRAWQLLHVLEGPVLRLREAEDGDAELKLNAHNAQIKEWLDDLIVEQDFQPTMHRVRLRK